ncbi:MAG: transcription termination factor NusA, partial [Candidatus Latescibacterota bacterium]
MTNFSIVEALTQIAREKNVDRQLVIQTLADALVSAARKRFGNTENYEAEIDATTGRMEVFARRTVVEQVQDPALEIDLEDAREIDRDAQLGTVVREHLDFADFGRNAIQTAKQILVQRVREAERERVYEEFSGRVGQLESGTVQQISRGDIILGLGRAEAAIPYREQIRRERYRQGDTVRAYIYEVLRSSRGPQVLLSRAHPELLKKLFAIEVPEIAEGIVQIHAVAREPGERAKIAVSSRDDRVDPVGACVGVKGSRVQAIVRELSGERIDIVPWSDDPEIFISRSLSPAVVSRVILDMRRRHCQVLVGSDQLSLAIGKGGQNSRLAVQLTGWGMDIITEEQYQKRRAMLDVTQRMFRRVPGVTELIALSLATSGFTTLREVAESSLEMLQTVPGLEAAELAQGIKNAAAAYAAEHPDEADGPPVEAPAAAAPAGAQAEASQAEPAPGVGPGPSEPVAPLEGAASVQAESPGEGVTPPGTPPGQAQDGLSPVAPQGE